MLRAMSRLKGLVHRARKLAEERLPPDLVDATKRVAQVVLEHAPQTVADRIGGGTEASEEPPTPAPAPTRDAPKSEEPLNEAERLRAAEVLERLRDKSEQGLKPEDRLVVVYATGEEASEVEEIKTTFAGIDTTLRHMDLDKEPAQTKRQLAKLTGVMVPPYVYINGKYWGAQYEMETLRASGDLENVVANRLDLIGDEAKRIGKIRESYSDEISVSNILERWKLGHILCVDDLDAWYEQDRDGTERFYYQGGPRNVADMQAVAEEITTAVEDDEYEATWMLDPAVSLS